MQWSGEARRAWQNVEMYGIGRIELQGDAFRGLAR
jgi:hypothetical protein